MDAGDVVRRSVHVGSSEAGGVVAFGGNARMGIYERWRSKLTGRNG